MINMNFLGQRCDGGVSQQLANKLQVVESDLRQTWVNQGSPDTFEEWAGVREPHRVAHRGGLHTTGDALDINYTSNPYIATRSHSAHGVDYGGEWTGIADINLARVLATTVYDRAVAFMSDQNAVANVSARGTNENIADIFDRFLNTSDALAAYLQIVFGKPSKSVTGIPDLIRRPPVFGAAQASLQTLLTAIPTTERFDEQTARDQVASALADPNFQPNHPDWNQDPEFWLLQILRDYEVVRIPMVYDGSPSLSPVVTRNPANGFLDLRREVVITLCEVGGLRWGASDFANAASGDVQHFDISQVLPCATGIADEVRVDLDTDAGIQQALASLQRYSSAIDGSISANGPTSQAIKQFCRDRNLPSEEIDDVFRAELGRALSEAAVPF